MMEKQLNALVIAAHPDDEVLGCGATIARISRLGGRVTVLILGEGKASRTTKNLSKETAALRKELLAANKVLGTSEVITENFPDNQFDSVPLLQIVKAIEAVKKTVKPNFVLTHHHGDINIDHAVTHRAALTAFRLTKHELAETLITFEVPSSTEWNSYSPTTAFVPNFFVDVEKYIEQKVKALASYGSELCEFPHPRSLENMRFLARSNGAKCGLPFAEAFQIIRARWK